MKCQSDLSLRNRTCHDMANHLLTKICAMFLWLTADISETFYPEVWVSYISVGINHFEPTFRNDLVERVYKETFMTSLRATVSYSFLLLLQQN